MGFILDESGMLSPTLERLGESDVAVVGYSESGRPARKPMSVAGVARLLRDLRGACEVAVPLQDIDKTIEDVEASGAPTAVKVVVSALLRRRSPLTVPTDG